MNLRTASKISVVKDALSGGLDNYCRLLLLVRTHPRGHHIVRIHLVHRDVYHAAHARLPFPRDPEGGEVGD